ncbi:MAG: hypothetical protein ACP5UM_15465, partial [Anaerolineae bacterium]
IGRYERFLARVNEVPLDTALRLLGLLNVRYILEPGPLEGMEPVHTTPYLRVYRNPYALPRAWVVPRARVVSDPEATLATLGQATFDPLQEVLLEEPVPLPGGTGAAPQGTRVAVWHASAAGGGATPLHSYATRLPNPLPGMEKEVRASWHTHGAGTVWNSEEAPLSLHIGPSGVTIDVALAEPGYLCLSQTFYPGWEARLDGEPAPVVRGDYLLTVVPLPAGEHQVALRYRPRSFWVGAGMSGAAWLALASAAGLRFWRGRRAGSPLAPAGQS